MAQIKLGDAEYQLAKDAVEATPDILEFLRKCEACGLPVEDRIASVNTDCEFCKAVLENFFPDRL